MAYILLNKPKKKISIPKIEAGRIYNSPIYKGLRLRKLAENPLCERCEAKDITRAAIETHHRIPFMLGTSHNARLKLAFDFYNLESLCIECHHLEHFNN